MVRPTIDDASVSMVNLIARHLKRTNNLIPVNHEYPDSSDRWGFLEIMGVSEVTTAEGNSSTMIADLKYESYPKHLETEAQVQVISVPIV